MTIATIIADSIARHGRHLFVQLDTEQKGYLEVSDLHNALASIERATGDATAATALFAVLDADRNGKITEQQLISILHSLVDALIRNLHRSSGSTPGCRLGDFRLEECTDEADPHASLIRALATDCSLLYSLAFILSTHGQARKRSLAGSRNRLAAADHLTIALRQLE